MRTTDTGLSRRAFIRTSALVVSGSAAVSCTTGEQMEGSPGGERSPPPPSQTPTRGVYAFFTAAQARTVEAVTARIIPGDADDPGAREAGVTTYIDAKLAQFEAYAEPTYRSAPFAEGYEGDEPPGPDTDEVVYVPAAELYRYGFQASHTPQSLYRDGLASLDRYSRRRFDAPFVDLADADQDAILTTLEGVGTRAEEPAEVSEPAADLDAAEEDFGDVDAGTFFDTLRQDTIDGMFADPMYGGNRGLVGWTMIGYPGAQRSYTAHEMKVGTTKQPQSLDGLHAMNPDHRDEQAPGALEQPLDGVVEG